MLWPRGDEAKAGEFWINSAITQVSRLVGIKAKFQEEKKKKLQTDDLGSW